MNPERLQELLNSFVDDQLDAGGQRELARALETDEAARRAFARAADQHQALRELLGQAVAEPRRRKTWAIAGVAAAAAAVALAVYLLPSGAPPPKSVPVATRETKPAPKPLPPAPPAPPAPGSEPVLPKEPAPAPTQPLPAPTPLPKEPAKPDAPVPSEPKPPETKPERSPAPAPPAKETVIAVATIESVRGEVHLLSASVRRAAGVGQAIGAGQGLVTGAEESSAVIVFPDSTRLELKSGTTLGEISADAGKRIILFQGSMVADVAKQPAGQPMTFSTRHALATILGARLALSCSDATRIEVKEGRARFTRLDDKRTIDVGAGQYSVAAKGQDLAARRTTRGPMMGGAAIWGEDFQEPQEVERDWSLQRKGLVVSTRGQLEFDPAPGGDASLSTRATFSPPCRISIDVEFTQRLKNTLVGLRLQSWKQEKEFVHADLDEDRYYLTIADQTVTADAPRKAARRERWTLELAADGGLALLVDGKSILKTRRSSTNEEYHVTLMTKAAKDVLPGARVRFDNLVVERIK
jgi:ferric-dicitrate binding protein FerR (iron transport regulator)